MTLGALLQLSWRKLKTAYEQGLDQRKEDQARMSVLLQLLLSQIMHFGCETFKQRSVKIIEEMNDLFVPKVEPREPLSGSSLNKSGKPIVEYAADAETRFANF